MATVNLAFDDSVNSAPDGFTNALNTAAQIVGSQIQDPISVTINVGYGEINGQPITGNTLAEGSPNAGLFVNYDNLVSDLHNSSNTSQDYQSFLANLPATDPGNGRLWYLGDAEAQALGLSIPLPPGLSDGSTGFSSLFNYSFDQSNVAPGTFDLVGIAEHELTHALGRFAAPGYQTPFDLAAYDPSTGLLNLNNGPDDRYFSIDGGQTNLVGINGSSDPADLSGFDGSGNPIVDPFNAFINGGIAYTWTALDSQIMGTLGFNADPPASSGAQSGDASGDQAAITPASLAQQSVPAFLPSSPEPPAPTWMPASSGLTDMTPLLASGASSAGGNGGSGSIDQPPYYVAGTVTVDPNWSAIVPTGNG